ncbi:MAG TPA: SIMPL domain-containing protein [Acidobacteriota bacterium]|jgi:hypothetical protein
MRNALVCLGLFLTVAPCLAQEGPVRPPLLYVTGEAQLKAPPDRAVVNLGVETRGKTVAEAREQNAQSMSAVINAVKKLGVPAADITTTRFKVSPQYDYQEKRTPPRIVGYSVSNQVSVKLDQIEKISEVVDAGLAAGANNVAGLDFMLKDPRTLRTTAYRDAVSDARSKATALASAAGVQLGRIYLLRESGGSVIPIRQGVMMEAMAMKASTPTPIESGEITIHVTVEIQFEIKQ